jgi:exopolysaccharide biosynthesis operon protein EpsL
MDSIKQKKSHSATAGKLLIVLAGAGMANCALALDGDVITPYTSYGVTHESNLFRFSSKQDALISTGSTDTSDMVTRASVGVRFDKDVSLQNFSGDVNLSKNKYSDNSQFDSDSKRANGRWNWQVGSKFGGAIGASYAESLSPFREFLSLAPTTDVTERNVRTQRGFFADGGWLISPSWRVRASYTAQDQDYELRTQRVNNGTLDTIETGVDYLARSNSSIGVLARQTRGRYDVSQNAGPSQISNDYRQTELNGRVIWQFSEMTRLQTTAGYVRRSYDALSERDSDGVNARIVGSWRATGKLNFALSAWREVGAQNYLSANVNRNLGLQLTSNWDVASKVKVTGRINSEKRSYNGVSLNDGEASGTRSDRYNEGSVSVAYMPTYHWTISAAVTRYRLSSSEDDRGYDGNATSLNMRYEF